MVDQTQDQELTQALSNPTQDSSPDQTPEPAQQDSSPPDSSSEPKSSLEALTEAVAPEEAKKPETADDEEPEEEDDEEEEPEEAGAAAEAKAEPDDDPRDKNWRKLRETTKEQKAEIESLRQQVEDLRFIERDLIKRSRASGEQLVKVFDFLEAINTGNLQGALPFYQEMGRHLSLATGRALPQASPIAEHPDLLQAVQSGQMPEDMAVQVAQTRFLAQRQQEQMRQQQEVAGRQQEYQAAVQSAISQINSLEAEWGKSINWAPVQKVISSQLPEIARNFPPNQWAQQVVMLKNAVEKAARQAAPKPTRSGPQPLRASGQAGGSKQPGNSVEAINQALGF